MTTLGLAFRTFFKLFSDAGFAENVKALFMGESPMEEAKSAPRITEKRNAALTLLSTLQREARFLDFVMESLDSYDDAQVGAVARDVHRDMAGVVRRIFAPEPLASEGEGSRCQVPPGFDPERFRLTGEVVGEPPYSGTLHHQGWQAARCEMPAWSGNVESAMVVAPAEVEVQ